MCGVLLNSMHSSGGKWQIVFRRCYKLCIRLKMASIQKVSEMCDVLLNSMHSSEKNGSFQKVS